MIIVQLMGGLGNQLFQYAFSRALEEKYQTRVKFDLTFYSNQKLDGDIPVRNYELDNFNVNIKKASPTEINHFKSYGKNPIIRQAFTFKRKFISSGKVFREHSLAYDKDFEKVNDNCYYSGYWHSEQYFYHIKSILANELTLRDSSLLNCKLLDAIKTSNSVSIHFRRGDYLTRSVSEVLSTCSLSYYYDAINFIYKKTDKPYFFIFSDDPEWVKENLILEYPFEIVSENQGDNSYKDMILMNNCRHNIIANSSFSWWGAWLNTNENKIVIAPKQWYKDPAINTNDLLPESWIKL
jgi:hypothetical protein